MWSATSRGANRAEAQECATLVVARGGVQASAALLHTRQPTRALRKRKHSAAHCALPWAQCMPRSFGRVLCAPCVLTSKG